MHATTYSYLLRRNETINLHECNLKVVSSPENVMYLYLNMSIIWLESGSSVTAKC
jgi:hypothetical protein